MTIDTENFLEHYGVKGQKWGVRRAKNRDSGRRMSPQEKAGIAFTATLLAAYGTLTLAAIKM